MSWTSEKPTEPGWYWLRTAESLACVEFKRSQNGTWFVYRGHRITPLDEIDGQWEEISPPKT